ncbi:MAG: RDD family protein [Deltaproteobacteria bacterium]|nr:RDD family protein [Deltaproteobacteria bacterium]
MSESSEPPSPNAVPPAEVWRRACARVVDLALCVSPLILSLHGHPRAAWTSTAALLLACDAVAGPGRSPGKRLFGLRTIVLATRRPAGAWASMVRNAVFLIALWPAFAPQTLQARLDGLGTLPMALATLALVCVFEALIALAPLRKDLGRRRFGDLLAGTQVVDASLALPLELTDRGRAARAAAYTVPSHKAARLAAPGSRAARTNSRGDTTCASH